MLYNCRNLSSARKNVMFFHTNIVLVKFEGNYVTLAASIFMRHKYCIVVFAASHISVSELQTKIINNNEGKSASKNTISYCQNPSLIVPLNVCVCCRPICNRMSMCFCINTNTTNVLDLVRFYAFAIRCLFLFLIFVYLTINIIQTCAYYLFMSTNEP